MAKTEGKPSGMNYQAPRGARAEPAIVDPTAEAMASLGSATGMVRTATQYQTAITVTKPRDLVKVSEAILHEAGEMGIEFIYTWRQNTSDPKLDEGDGKMTIEGMSIDGAMVMARNFGNCGLPTELAMESPTHYLFLCTFIDFETGFNFPRLYRQRKSGGPGGRMDQDRKEDIAFQIGQSKAQRNAIDKAMPSYLKTRAIDAAKNSAAKRLEPVSEHKPKSKAYFEAMGVKLSQLERRLGRPYDIWTAFDLLKLVVIAKSLRDRETTLEEEFPKPGEAAAQPGDGAASTAAQDSGATATTSTTVTESKPAPSPFDDLPPQQATATATAATATGQPVATTQATPTPASVEEVRAKLASQGKDGKRET